MSRASAQAVATVFASCRDGDADHLHWDWVQTFDQHSEAWLILSGGEAVAAWAGKHSRPTIVAGVPSFRLDFLEVRSAFLGQIIGPAVVLSIAACAHELGAVKIVGGAMPRAIDFWLRLGAEMDRSVWDPGSDLQPFVTTRSTSWRGCSMATASKKENPHSDFLKDHLGSWDQFVAFVGPRPCSGLAGSSTDGASDEAHRVARMLLGPALKTGRGDSGDPARRR